MVHKETGKYGLYTEKKAVNRIWVSPAVELTKQSVQIGFYKYARRTKEIISKELMQSMRIMS